MFKVPDNSPVTGLAQGMVDAWEIYGNDKAVILFVVEDITYNICDQRFHEFEISKINSQVKVIRKTLSQIHDCGHLSCDKELLV